MKHLLILISIAALFGCSNNSSDSSQTENEAIPIVRSFSTQDTLYIIASGDVMSEIKYSKKVIRVPSNKEITIALTNESKDATMTHNMVIIQIGTANEVGQNGAKYKDNAHVDPNDPNVIAHSQLAEIGTTIYFTFTTPASGDYEFICTFPGHWGLMNGKFITQETT